jgi:hypothetical protein
MHLRFMACIGEDFDPTDKKNLPRALPHGSSMSAPSRCDRDTALVYVYSDDDDPLPFEAKEDVCLHIFVCASRLIPRL